MAEAYIRGLEKRAARGERRVAERLGGELLRQPHRHRWWTKTIAAREKAGATPQQKALFDEVTGKVAIANAKQAYRKYKELFSGPRWQALADKGAKTQRVLWASTGTKNPKYSDVLYVEELIGPDTVEHHAAGDARRLPRPRQGEANPRPGRSTRPTR